MSIEPGIYPDLSITDYHASDGLSRSAMVLLRDNPYKFWYQYLSGNGERPMTAAMQLGELVHVLVQEPHRFDDQFYVIDDGIRRGTKAFQSHADEAGERSIIKQSDYDQAQSMAQQLLKLPYCSAMRDRGLIEHSLYWYVEETLVKARPDAYYNGVAMDIKTMASVSERKLSYAIADYGYDIQAALVCDGLTELTGIPYTDFVLCCVEKTPPYVTRPVYLGDAIIEHGRQKYLEAIETYNTCLQTGEWPGDQLELTMLEEL